MKFFFLNEKTYKNNFYFDYFFKNIVFFFFKNITGNNFIYLIDKYLAENLMLSINSLFSFTFFFINSIKLLNFNKILQITLLVVIQIVIFVIL